MRAGHVVDVVVVDPAVGREGRGVEDVRAARAAADVAVVDARVVAGPRWRAGAPVHAALLLLHPDPVPAPRAAHLTAGDPSEFGVHEQDRRQREPPHDHVLGLLEPQRARRRLQQVRRPDLNRRRGGPFCPDGQGPIGTVRRHQAIAGLGRRQRRSQRLDPGHLDHTRTSRVILTDTRRGVPRRSAGIGAHARTRVGHRLTAGPARGHAAAIAARSRWLPAFAAAARAPRRARPPAPRGSPRRPTCRAARPARHPVAVAVAAPASGPAPPASTAAWPRCVHAGLTGTGPSGGHHQQGNQDIEVRYAFQNLLRHSARTTHR